MSDPAAPADVTQPRVARAPRRGLLAWLALLVRGMAMGVAELVPGISGGTIAFVTGIYFELVSSLASFRAQSIALLWRRGPLAFWRAHNLSFLVVLGLGMLLAVLAFARLFQYLLETVPVAVWAFFFGLIAASVVQIGRGRAPLQLAGFGVLGLLGGLALMLLNPADADPSLWMFFAGGALAVSAWLLPAVSGSFLLLVLGLYEPVLRALNDGHVPVIAALLSGCAFGILAFARLLNWLMGRFREPVLSLLTGFMAGSLASLWPWRTIDGLLSPAAYQAATGTPALVLPALLAAGLGVLALWLLSRLE